MRAGKTESDYAERFLDHSLLSARQIIDIIIFILLSLFLFIVFKFYLKIKR